MFSDYTVYICLICISVAGGLLGWLIIPERKGYSIFLAISISLFNAVVVFWVIYDVIEFFAKKPMINMSLACGSIAAFAGIDKFTQILEKAIHKIVGVKE